MKALHYSEGKPSLATVPPEVLAAYDKIRNYGADKYDDLNWYEGTRWSEFTNSALRHLYAWFWKETKDPESGLDHLHHALWNVATLIVYAHRGIGEDDRYVHTVKSIDRARFESDRQLDFPWGSEISSDSGSGSGSSQTGSPRPSQSTI